MAQGGRSLPRAGEIWTFDERFAFWIDAEGIMRAPKAGGVAERILWRRVRREGAHDTGFFPRDERAIATDAENVYFTEGKQVRAVAKPR